MKPTTINVAVILLITLCAVNFQVSANTDFCKQKCRDLLNGCMSYCLDIATCSLCLQIGKECKKKCRKTKTSTTLGQSNIRKFKKLLKKYRLQSQHT